MSTERGLRQGGLGDRGGTSGSSLWALVLQRAEGKVGEGLVGRRWVRHCGRGGEPGLREMGTEVPLGLLHKERSPQAEESRPGGQDRWECRGRSC